MSNAVTNQYFQIDPAFVLVPGLAILITVMAFNLFGDGPRAALDPRTRCSFDLQPQHLPRYKD